MCSSDSRPYNRQLLLQSTNQIQDACSTGPMPDREIAPNLKDRRTIPEVNELIAHCPHSLKTSKLSGLPRNGSDCDPTDHVQNVTLPIAMVARLINKRAQDVKAQFAGQPRLRRRIQIRERLGQRIERF